MKEIESLGEAVGRLIVARLDGSITPEENAILTAWLEQSPDHRTIYAEYAALNRGVSRPSPARNLDDALDKVWEKAGSRRRKTRVWSICAAAAVIVALVMVGIVLSLRTQETVSTVNRIANVDNPSMHIELPDGSDVWLRPGAELRYDESFNVEDRSIELKGEAYFDVAQDPGKPFYVRTPDFRVRVLGTAFNVKSLPQGRSEVTLTRGSIAMQTPEGKNLLRLSPGQKASRSEDGLFDVEEVSAGDLLLTSYGVISLDNATLDEIISSIESQYGITIRISPEGVVDGHRYNFNFQRDSSPASVVDLLGFICQDKKFTIVE